jgi:LAO/AO transport system kinase
VTGPEPSSALSVQPGVPQPPPINRGFVARKARTVDVRALVEGVVAGDRMALSRAITLVESARQQDREAAAQVIEGCLPHSGGSMRVGITGVPGVGKSLFIEALGARIVERRRVAVLAIDPSSERTCGSILGDKSRMPALAAHPCAYVRPSPSGATLGGVARRTREAMVLVEAAGYDVVLVETVGVGQSESAVHAMTDAFLLLMLAGAGDELQGIKRGIMEMADVVAITKADGANRAAAEVARADYQGALHLFPPGPGGWTAPVLLCSSLTGDGIEEVWETLVRYVARMREIGRFEERRSEQAAKWMREAIGESLHTAFERNPEVRAMLPALTAKVRRHEITPQRAAEELLARFWGRPAP